jgi:hypothetical protein
VSSPAAVPSRGPSLRGKSCTSDLEEAEAWLASARFLLDAAGERRSWFTVVVAQVIHSLIKANDALTFRFLVRRSARHEDAPSLFGELVRSGSVPPEMARWRRVLTRAIREKSAYDYGSREIGRGEAER